MNTTADMKRKTADYDDMGSVVYTLATFSEAHPCRISMGVPSDVSSGPIEYARAAAMVFVLPDTDFARDDEVHHGSNIYKVVGVREPSIANHHRALVCEVTYDGV